MVLISSLNSNSLDTRYFELECSALETHLKERAFELIASDVHLFWVAFCKVFMQTQPSDDSFVVKKQFETPSLLITGTEGTIKDIRLIVEKFRPFFTKDHCTVVAIKICEHISWLGYYYFCERRELVFMPDGYPSSSRKFVCLSLFDNCVFPALLKLAETLDFSLTIEKNHHQTVARSSFFPGSCKSIDLIEESVPCEIYLFQKKSSLLEGPNSVVFDSKKLPKV